MIVSCPSCQRNYVVADEQIAGKQFRARCKSCGVEFRLDGTPNRSATNGQGEQEPERFMSATERFLALQSAPPAGKVSTPPNGKPPSVPPADKEAAGSGRKSSSSTNGQGTWSVCLSQTDTRRMTTDEISAALAQGSITTGVFVWKSGMSTWVRMSEVPELSARGADAGNTTAKSGAETDTKSATPSATEAKSATDPKAATPSSTETRAATVPTAAAKHSVPPRSGRTVPPPHLPDINPPPKSMVPVDPSAASGQGSAAASSPASVAPKPGVRRTATIGGVGAVRHPTPRLPLKVPAEIPIDVDVVVPPPTPAPVPTAQPAAAQQAGGTPAQTEAAQSVAAPAEANNAASSAAVAPSEQIGTSSPVPAPALVEGAAQTPAPIQAPTMPGKLDSSAPASMVGGAMPVGHPVPATIDQPLPAQATPSHSAWSSGPAPAMPRGPVSESYSPVVRSGDNRRVAGAVIAAGVVGLVGVLGGAIGAAYVMKSAMGIAPQPVSSAAVVVLSPQAATPAAAPAPNPVVAPDPAASTGRVGSAAPEPAPTAAEPAKPAPRAQPVAVASRSISAPVSKPAAKAIEHPAPASAPAEAKPPSSKAAKANEPAPAAPAAGGAPIDREAATAVLGMAAARAATCKKPDGPTGSVKIYVTFDPSGSVVMSNVVGAPIAGTPVAQCIAGWFRRVKVAPFSGDRVSFTKEITIQ